MLNAKMNAHILDALDALERNSLMKIQEYYNIFFSDVSQTIQSLIQLSTNHMSDISNAIKNEVLEVRIKVNDIDTKDNINDAKKYPKLKPLIELREQPLEAAKHPDLHPDKPISNHESETDIIANLICNEDERNLSRVPNDTFESQTPANTNCNVILSEYKQHVISEHDYKTLEYGELLNDNVVDFYLCYLQHEKLDSEKCNDIHVYSSNFYARLKGSTTFEIKNKAKRVKQEEEEYLRVKDWTRKINIFSKYMLIIPVCEDEHWYLIIVCNPGLVGERTEDYQKKNLVSSIMVLDSLGISHKKSVERIRSYLTYEHFERFKLPQSFRESDIRLKVPVVPHQLNSCDSGIYTLHYVEKIFQSFNLFLTKDVPNLATWFRNPNDIVTKRRTIAKIIQSMAIVKESDL